MKKSLTLVTLLSVGTALTTLGNTKPVAASLTPPIAYDYSYTWNATDTEQYLNVNGVDSIPLYTRTADGVYSNYTNTSNIVDGFNVTMTFNRSNTAWQASGAFYKPDENKIGSDNNVGSIQTKVGFSFNNNTNRDYYLYFDNSSSPGSRDYFVLYNDSLFVTYFNDDNFFNRAILIRIPIFAFSTLNIYSRSTNNAIYFDAWYLKDLGVSQAWTEGFDNNRPGILTEYLGTDAQQIGWVLLGIAAILFVFKGGK
jgi:hypothetical protein